MKPVLTRDRRHQAGVHLLPDLHRRGRLHHRPEQGSARARERQALMGADGMFSADFVKAAGARRRGHYLSSPDFTRLPGGYQDFLDKYKAKFGIKPLSIFHAHAYDAASILFAAHREGRRARPPTAPCTSRKGALRDALFATKDFQGVTGTLTCTPTATAARRSSPSTRSRPGRSGRRSPGRPTAPIWKPQLVGGARHLSLVARVTKPRGGPASRRSAPRDNPPSDGDRRVNGRSPIARLTRRRDRRVPVGVPRSSSCWSSSSARS